MESDLGVDDGLLGRRQGVDEKRGVGGEIALEQAQRDRPELFYVTQAAIAPPTFVFFASDASGVHFSYRRYLENQLRETFGFDGTTIRLVFRDRASVKLPRRKKTRSAPVKAVRRPAAARTRRSR